MFGAIVLRDIPKRAARIDLVRLPIQGGFRGFGMVPPGLHYVSVQQNAHHVGFWCWVKPQQAVVKVFDMEAGFEDADADTQARYAQLALSGAMGPALLPYPHAKFGPWFGMTMHISEDDFPPAIHTEDVVHPGVEGIGAGSRFDRALLGTHQGNGDAFLAEFQYAFVAWLVSTDMATQDETAFARWRHLVLAAYNAGEDRIREAGHLFGNLLDTLMRQCDALGDDCFTPDSFLLSNQAAWMVEDMEDAGVEGLAEKGRVFLDYLERRKT